MKSVMIVSGLLAVAGTAMGQSISAFNTESSGREITSVGPTGGAAELSGGVTNFNVAGIASWDLQGSGFNTVVNFDLASALGYAPGTPITMNGIGWDVNLATVGASWLSEMGIYFDDNIAPDLSGLFLSPGAGSNAPGAANFNSGGIIKLAPNNIPNILLPNGVLRMEFFEGYDDVSAAIDGNWLSGSLQIQTVEQAVPAPGVAGLFGLAGLAAARRRRA